MRTIHGLILVASLVNVSPAVFAQTASETPPEMLAAQVRMQGIPCDKSLSATQDKKRSKPDHAVWVLKCSNATYRVSRAPDMAARVERLK